MRYLPRALFTPFHIFMDQKSPFPNEYLHFCLSQYKVFSCFYEPVTSQNLIQHNICERMMYNNEVFVKFRDFYGPKLTSLWICTLDLPKVWQMVPIRFWFYTKFWCKIANKIYCKPKCKVEPLIYQTLKDFCLKRQYLMYIFWRKTLFLLIIIS